MYSGVAEKVKNIQHYIILLLSKRNQLKRYLWIQGSRHVYIVPPSMALWLARPAVCNGYHTAKDCTGERVRITSAKGFHLSMPLS